MNHTRLRGFAFVAALALLTTPFVFAQNSGDIALTVDATQAPMHIIHTRMVMPVTAGPLTLYYP